MAGTCTEAYRFVLVMQGAQKAAQVVVDAVQQGRGNLSNSKELSLASINSVRKQVSCPVLESAYFPLLCEQYLFCETNVAAWNGPSPLH